MPPKSRTSAGAKKVRRKEKKNVAHGHAHIKSTFNNTIVSITDPPGHVIAWASRRPRRLQGLAQVHAVRRADGRRGAPRDARRSTACRRSTSSSRAPAPAARPRSARCRPPASRSARSRTSPRPAQRLPSAQAPPRLTEPRRRLSKDGPYTWPDCTRCRRRRRSSCLKGRPRSVKYPIREPSLPARPARPRRDQGERVPACRCGRSRRRAHLRRPREAVPRLLRGGEPAAGKTGENLLQILESRLDNVVYRAGFARTRRHARQLVGHGHFLVNGHKVDIPSLPGRRARHHRGPPEVARD